MAYYDSYNVYVSRHGMFVDGSKVEITDEIVEQYNRDRFWTKVSITANDKLCWNWKSERTNRYGSFGLNGKVESSNRIAYLYYYGVNPKELFVLHKCDNRRCCNPKHLFLGTFTDNMRDMAAKGRTGVKLGIANNKAKLTQADIPEIIRLNKNGETYASISRKYPITPETVSSICKGKIWKHLNLNKDAT